MRGRVHGGEDITTRLDEVSVLARCPYDTESKTAHKVAPVAKLVLVRTSPYVLALRKNRMHLRSSVNGVVS